VTEIDSFNIKKIGISLLPVVEHKLTRFIGLGMRYNHGLTKISKTRWYGEQDRLLGIVKENSYYLLFYTAMRIK